MGERLQGLINMYPRQFWLLFWGLLISTIGTSMIWPFLMIYVSERLNLSLTLVASLMTLNAAMGLLSSFFAGPIIDRAGRKWVMAISLCANGLVYFGLSRADSLPAFAVLMAISGAFSPLYRVGANAMMADLIQPERRADAYSLLRTGNNLGVALGPAIGGIIATISYATAFYFAAGGLLIYSLLVTFLAVETLPARPPDEAHSSVAVKERFGGYGRVLGDRQFISFVGTYTLVQICAAMMWVLLAVYAKENYAVSESLYGFIPTTNALMVVFFQYSVTQVTKRRQPLFVLAVGALLYSAALGSVALGRGFWGFWLSMVILTVGELIQSPTATTLAANLAPAEMRGRYMSLYGLTWGVATGVGPVLGGLLNDHVGPAAIWYGGAAIGLTSGLLFLSLVRRYERRAAYAR
jgi:MFS family permease